MNDQNPDNFRVFARHLVGDTYFGPLPLSLRCRPACPGLSKLRPAQLVPRLSRILGAAKRHALHSFKKNAAASHSDGSRNPGACLIRIFFLRLGRGVIERTWSRLETFDHADVRFRPTADLSVSPALGNSSKVIDTNALFRPRRNAVQSLLALADDFNTHAYSD